jgi:hypothetical protein
MLFSRWKVSHPNPLNALKMCPIRSSFLVVEGRPLSDFVNLCVILSEWMTTGSCSWRGRAVHHKTTYLDIGITQHHYEGDGSRRRQENRHVVSEHFVLLNVIFVGDRPSMSSSDAHDSRGVRQVQWLCHPCDGHGSALLLSMLPHASQ